MGELWADNAIGHFNTLCTGGATALHISTDYGTFPAPAANQEFHAVLNPSSNPLIPNATTEVVTVTANSAGVWTTSTTAFGHAVNEPVALIVSSAGLGNIAGTLIGRNENNAHHENTTASTSMVEILAAYQWTFVAPPSGAVEWSATGYWGLNGSGNALFVQPHITTLGLVGLPQAVINTLGNAILTTYNTITGLVAGTTYTIEPYWSVISSASSGELLVGTANSLSSLIQRVTCL